MKTIFIILFLSIAQFSTSNILDNIIPIHNENDIIVLFKELHSVDLSYKAYKNALIGYNAYTKDSVITSSTIAIIDFDLPSTKKRLFIIDIDKNKVIYSSLVAHGVNSGENYASKFSNINGSHQSSLGFFNTQNTYIGKHGVSLKLNGLEKGINNNANTRNIVIHKADYVSFEFISKNNRLGRSHGCPALPIKDYDKVLSHLKNGTLLYIFSSK